MALSLTAVHRRRALAVMAAGVLALAVAGCGGASGGGGKSLTYWSMWKESEPQGQVLKETAEAFKKSTGISVDIQWQGRDVLKKLTPALRGGDVPDLVDQDENVVKATLVSTDAHRELSGLYGTEVPGSGKKVSDLIPAKYLTTLQDKANKPFMLPYEILGFGLWFDGARLPEVAAKPPANWAEFAALLAKRKADGASPIALDSDANSYSDYWTIGMLQGALGPGKVAELVKDKTGKAWDTPQVRAVLTEITRWIGQGYFIPGYDGSKWPAMQEKWAQGAADFINVGSWIPSETGPKAKAGFQYRFTPLPAFGDKAHVPANTIGFAIPRRAKNAENAEKFLAFFLADEHLGKIATVAKNLPPNPKLAPPAELADLSKALVDLPVSRPLDGIDADFPGYADEVFYPVNARLIRGKTDVNGFVTELGAKQADYWKKTG